MADLQLYLSTQDQQPGAVIANWQELGFWRTILPTSLRGAERALYLAEVETLLTLLKNQAKDADVRRSA